MQRKRAAATSRAATGPKIVQKRRLPLESTSVMALVLAVAIVMGGALLLAAVVVGPLAEARHPVLTVDGTQIDRTELRNRMELDGAMRDIHAAAIRTAVSEGHMSEAQADVASEALERQFEDPVRTAIDGLVMDEVLRQAARELGLATDADPGRELARAVAAERAVMIRYVAVQESGVPVSSDGTGWPPPPAPGSGALAVAGARDEAARAALRAMQGGASATDAALALTSAGWRATGADRWLAEADASQDMPPELINAAIDPGNDIGSAIGPITDRVTGITAVALIVYRSGGSYEPAAAIAGRQGIDAATLDRWARARVAERAIRASLVGEWRSDAILQVRAAEVVVGSADVEGIEGDYRSFAHLVLDNLRGVDDASSLARELAEMDVAERTRSFDDLIARANISPGASGVRESGETGFFTRDQIIAELAERAFELDVLPGAIIGPIETAAGPELFILRSRFSGVLDERANAALVEVRASTDLVALAERISPPGHAHRAEGQEWLEERIASATTVIDAEPLPGIVTEPDASINPFPSIVDLTAPPPALSSGNPVLPIPTLPVAPRP